MIFVFFWGGKEGWYGNNRGYYTRSTSQLGLTHIPVNSGAREQYAAHLYADAEVGRPLVPSLFLYSFVDAACRFPYITM